MAAVASPAGAQPFTISVEAGKQAQAWVGNAIGWFCDDPTLVTAALVTEGGINYWVVEGVRVGRTTCRVGTDPSRASFVFDVTVENPAAKPPG